MKGFPADMQGSSRFFTGASSQAIIRADYQFLQKRSEKIWSVRNFAYLCNPKTKEREVLTENGVIAQLVEQRTENPCVPGSIPGDTTLKIPQSVVTDEVATLFFLWGKTMVKHSLLFVVNVCLSIIYVAKIWIFHNFVPLFKEKPV